MTERKIVIKTCEECKYCGSDGSFSLDISLCEKSDKILPHVTTIEAGVYLLYKPTYEIPEWCPLEKNKPEPHTETKPCLGMNTLCSTCGNDIRKCVALLKENDNV